MKKILKIILIYIIFFYSWLIKIPIQKIFNIKTTNKITKQSILLSTFSTVFLLIILLIIYRKNLKKDLKEFKKDIKKNLNIGFNNWLVGLILMSLTNIILNILIKSPAGNQVKVNKMIDTLPFLMIINAGIFAPINEELVFRKNIDNLFKNNITYYIVSGIIFGLAHVIFSINRPVDILYMLPYTALGIALAKSYKETNSIITPILFHMFHNTYSIIVTIIKIFI